MLEPTRAHTPDTAAGMHAKRAIEPAAGLGDLPDLLLVERTRNRDTRAFETLMRRYNRRLFRIARSILSDDNAAEDAVRGAHLRAFANLDGYEPAGKFGAWLARLAFNEGLASRKHGGQAAVADARADQIGVAPASAADGTQISATRRMIESAIDALPEVFRTVLVLRLVEELSGVEVAVCLGLHETTVRTRLYRAQQRLQVDVARQLRAEPFNIFELTPERSDRIVQQVLVRLHGSAQEPR
ncbi:MAG TPA: sigma-70 family RNA polymerase sigma factor [Steroidobacteraceae bacterium]|nr:sigma-70 family RNA polymerase sigma factor [Steroidobacteraceae bacterium]